MADSAANRYLISVVLQDKQNAMATLVSQVEALQRAAKSPIDIRVGLDAAGLATLESQVASAVKRAMSRGGAGGMAAEVEQEVAEGIKKGRRKAATHNAADNATVQALKRDLADLKAAGGLKFEVDTRGMDRAFKRMADTFATQLQGQLKNLKILDLDQIMRAAGQWRQALGAGLSAPFMPGKAGMVEAAGVLRDPGSSALARKLAQAKVLEYQREIDGQRLREASQKAQERRTTADRALAKMSEDERARRRTLYARGAQGGKDIESGQDPHILVRGKEVALRAAEEAHSKIKALQETIQRLMKGVPISREGKVVGNRKLLGDTVVHAWGSGAEVDPTGPHTSAVGASEALAPFMSNPLLRRIVERVKSVPRARQALVEARKLQKDLDRELAIASKFGPKRMPAAPTAAPWDILEEVDERDLLAMIGGGKMVSEPGSRSYKAAKRYKGMRKFEAAGGQFTPYGPYETALIEQQMRAHEKAGDLGKVQQIRRELQGGEWTTGVAAGFPKLYRTLGDVKLAGPAPAATGGGGAGGGGGGGRSYSDMGAALGQLSGLDFGKVTQGIKAMTESVALLESALARLAPQAGGGRLAPVAKAAAAWARLETARAQGATMQTKKEIQGTPEDRAAMALAVQADKAGEREETDKRRKQDAQDIIDKRAQRTAGLAKLRTDERLRYLREKRSQAAEALKAIAGAGPGASRQAQMNAMVQAGVMPGLGMSEAQLTAALGSNVRKTFTQQEGISDLAQMRKQLEQAGAPTGAVDTQLFKRGLALDRSGERFLNLLANLGFVNPEVGKKFPVHGVVGEWQQRQTERTRIHRLFGRTDRAPSWVTPEGLQAATETEGTVFPASWRQAAQAKSELHARYGGPDQALTTAKRLREEQHAMVNSLKEGVNKHLEAESSLKRQGGMVDFIANKFKSLAAYMGVGFFLYRAASGIGAAVRDVVQLDEALAHLRGVLKGASLTDLLEIKTGILASAREFGQSVEIAAKAARDFGQMGLSPAEVVASTRAVMMAMAGLRMTDEQAVNLAVSAREMSEGRIKGTDIFDRLARIQRGHPVTAEGLAAVVERSGALGMALMPQRFGTVDALDVLLGSQATILSRMKGVGPAQAATTTGYMLSKLMTPSTQRLLEQQFGIRMGTGEPGKLRPFPDIISDVSSRYKQLEGTASGQNLLALLAGPRQGRQLITLFENWGEVMQIAEESSQSGGEAAKFAAIQMETLGFQMKSFGASLREYMDSLLRSLGVLGGHQALLPALVRGVGLAKAAPATALVGGLVATAGLAGAVGLGARGVGSRAAWLANSSWLAGRGVSTALGGVATGGAALGTTLTGMFGYIAVIAAIVGAVMVAMKIYKLAFSSEETSGSEEQRKAVNEKQAELASQYGLPPSALSARTTGAFSEAQRRADAKFGRGYNPQRYWTTVDEAAGILAESGVAVPEDPNARAQAIGELLKVEMNRLASMPSHEQVPVFRYDRFGEQTMTGYKDNLGNLSTERQRLLRLRGISQQLAHPANRPTGLAAEAMPGYSPGRDRLMEAFVSYGVNRAEVEAMGDFAGTIGYDYAGGKRRVARTLVEQVARSGVEIQADVLRAQEALLRLQGEVGVEGMIEGGNPYYDLTGGLNKPSEVETNVSQAEVRRKQTLGARLEAAQKMLEAMRTNKTLLDELKAQGFQGTLADVVLGKGASAAEKENFIRNVLGYWSEVKGFSRDVADNAEREFVARERAKASLEIERDMHLAILESTQRRAQLDRETGISRAELFGATAGAGFAGRRTDILARGDEDVARVRAQRGYERRLIDQNPETSDEMKEFMRWRSSLDEQREVVVALEKANLDADTLLTNAKRDLERDRLSSAREMVRGSTGGLRDALAGNFSEAWAGKPAAQIVLEPAFATIRKKMADNFIDAWFGPQGVLGPQMEKLMGVTTLMDRELLVRERYVAMLQGAVETEQAARIGSLPGTTTTLEAGGAPATVSNLPGVSLLGTNNMEELVVPASVTEALMPKPTSLLGTGSPMMAGPNAAGLAASAALPMGTGVGGIPRYVDPAMLTPQMKTWLRANGATDLSRVWLNAGGEWMYDLQRKTGKGLVDTHRIGAASGQRPGEAIDSYYGRVQSTLKGTPEPPMVSAMDSLDANARLAFADMMEAAKMQGFNLIVKDAGRSQARQEWIYANRPGATHTLTSNHTTGNAIDFDVGGGRMDEWRAWVAQQPGFHLLDNWDKGHVEFTGGRAGGGGALGLFGGLLSDPAFQGMLQQRTMEQNLENLTGVAFKDIANAAVTGKPPEVSKWAMAGRQAKMMLAQQAGMMLGGALNSDRGAFGVRTGVNKGYNWGNEGATAGTMVGGMFGPLGALAGGVLGGLFGGLFPKRRPKDTPEAQALEAIERNTRETVTVIESQTKMLSFGNRLVGVPASFRYPGFYPVVSGGGGSSVQHFEINIDGSGDPQSTAAAVMAAIKGERRGQGNFVSVRR